MLRGWHQVHWLTPVCSSSKITRRLCCLSLLSKHVVVNALSIQLHSGTREGNVLGQIGFELPNHGVVVIVNILIIITVL